MLEYDGTAYNGWQRQPHGISVQLRVEEALRRVLGGEQVSVVASGRTDSGVHALGQVCSIRAETPRLPEHIRDGLNHELPPDISCLGAERVSPRFHAQLSATGKLYRYVLRVGPSRSALRRERCWQQRGPLNLSAMQEALDRLVGEHDFTSFRASGCCAKSPVRRIRTATIGEVADEVWIELYGEGFLRHQVRNIVGSLITVGRERQPPGWFDTLLQAKDRRIASRTAPPQGLYLVRVDYPPELLNPDFGVGEESPAEAVESDED